MPRSGISIAENESENFAQAKKTKGHKLQNVQAYPDGEKNGSEGVSDGL